MVILALALALHPCTPAVQRTALDDTPPLACIQAATPSRDPPPHVHRTMWQPRPHS